MWCLRQFTGQDALPYRSQVAGRIFPVTHGCLKGNELIGIIASPVIGDTMCTSGAYVSITFTSTSSRPPAPSGSRTSTITLTSLRSNAASQAVSQSEMGRPNHKPDWVPHTKPPLNRGCCRSNRRLVPEIQSDTLGISAPDEWDVMVASGLSLKVFGVVLTNTPTLCPIDKIKRLLMIFPM